ncbi:MAG: cytochrome c oxidase subunit II [Crocinitomicaceae bacterium]|nr:cytochrome c oxidase subunit II [Crocinitomicaceae bacterium]
MKLIVLAVIVLTVIAVAQLMRVYELSSKLRGHREEDINLKTNNINAGLMLVFITVFFGSTLYMLWLYGNGGLPEAASEHGVDVDWLYGVNWIIVFTVFFVTNSLLFFFAYKYSYHPERKAYYFPHDNKLEMIWTVVPAAALAVIIILGLMTWNKITGAPSDDAVVVELYAKQFDWTVRYSGEDNQLGYADYKLVNGENPLGVITSDNIDKRIAEIDDLIEQNQTRLDGIANGTNIASAANEYKLQHDIEKMGRIKQRIIKMAEAYNDSIYSKANDDFTSKSALFLIKGKEYQFVLRSRDVLHSAYFPHFRAQMNCVPGMRTTIKFTPTITTQEMREKTGNKDFSYILLCNKICGVSHSNMFLPVIVGSEEEFQAWRNDGVSTAMIVSSAVEVAEELEVEEPAMEAQAEGEEAVVEGEGGDHN